MKTVLRIFLALAGAVIIIWFLIPAFITWNFHIGVLTGAGIGLVLFIYGLFFSPINRGIGRLWKHAAGKVVILLVTAVLCAIICCAGLCIYKMVDACRSLPAAPYANTAQPNNISADAGFDESPTVLILGAKVNASGPSLSLITRLDAALGFLNDHPDASCIVCGGQGNNEPVTEASSMRRYLVQHGIEPERIWLEDASLDTYENLTNASGIIEKNGLNPQTVIVTNDYHMYRSLSYARDIGFSSPAALPAPTLWWLFPSQTVREMYGIMEMWLLK